MSDNATLVERLRVGLMAVAAFVRGNADAKQRVHDAINAVEEAAARIAELEAVLVDASTALHTALGMVEEPGFVPNWDYLRTVRESIRTTLSDPSEEKP